MAAGGKNKLDGQEGTRSAAMQTNIYIAYIGGVGGCFSLCVCSLSDCELHKHTLKYNNNNSSAGAASCLWVG